MNVIVEVNGSAIINFEDTENAIISDKELVTIKNRFCCPEDETPLITILSKNVKEYKLEISCKACNKKYISEMK